MAASLGTAAGVSISTERIRGIGGTWYLLGAAMAIQVGVSIVDQGLPALLGFIRADLGLTSTSATLLISALILGRCLGSYAAGIVADAIGERRVLIAAGVLSGALTVVGATMAFPVIYGLLFLAGIASAAATPAGGRLIALSFPPTFHGRALGMRQAAVPLGGLAAAAILPWIAHAYGWRSGLACAGLICIVSVTPLGIVRARGRPRHVRVQRSRVNPFHNRDLVVLTIWGSLLVSGQYALIAFLILDLHARMTLSLASASTFLVVAQMSGALGRVVWGGAMDLLGTSA